MRPLNHNIMKRNFLNFWITIVLIVITIADADSQIKIWKTNPHYFCYKDKPVVLITSDHHYGAVIDMDFDYVKYLDYLAEQT